MTTPKAAISVPYVYAPEILGLGATLPAIGCIIVALRFYVRRVQKTAVSIDDWLILGGLVCSSSKSHLRAQPNIRIVCR